jgi:hypothetical protein
MGKSILRLDVFTRQAQAPLYAKAPYKASQATRLFQVHGLPKALPHYRVSSSPIPLSNYIHILDEGIIKSTIV